MKCKLWLIFSCQKSYNCSTWNYGLDGFDQLYVFWHCPPPKECSAVDKSEQPQNCSEMFWEHRKSNWGPLGGKQENYPLCFDWKRLLKLKLYFYFSGFQGNRQTWVWHSRAWKKASLCWRSGRCGAPLPEIDLLQGVLHPVKQPLSQPPHGVEAKVH